MIIDRILDRKEGEAYSPKQFYMDCMDYGEVGHDIARAMDFGTERQVKAALFQYLIDNEYNPEICYYINSVNWL